MKKRRTIQSKFNVEDIEIDVRACVSRALNSQDPENQLIKLLVENDITSRRAVAYAHGLLDGWQAAQ